MPNPAALTLERRPFMPEGPIGRLLTVIHQVCSAIAALPRPEAAPENFAAGLRTANAFLWLHRVIGCVGRLATRLAAGTLRPLRPRARGDVAAPRLGAPNTLPLPRATGWLARALAEPEPLVAELTNLLADPELQSLLAQEPARFGRLLRPLCRAMGLTPPELLRATPRTPSPQTASPPAARGANVPRKPATPQYLPSSPGPAALDRFCLTPQTPSIRAELLGSVVPRPRKIAFA